MGRLSFCAIFILIISSISCSIQRSDEVQNLIKETDHVHDETMVLMDTSSAIQNKLTRLIQAAESDSTIGAFQHLDSLKYLKSELVSADHEMMDWMATYSRPDGNMSDDKAISYLKGKIKHMESIHKNMSAGMEQAEGFLKRVE
ncbi:MAG TPA: hypothetical protein DDX92_00810 [Flavobacteriales bacterium]|jgi:hypothetical protein|nr:hypothetical protein [Flavobacteriales bacterium]